MTVASKVVAFIPALRRLRGSLAALKHQLATLQAGQTRLAADLSEVLGELHDLRAVAPAAATPGLADVPLFVPPGHYYSPVVRPADVVRQGLLDAQSSDGLLGLAIDYPAMATLFAALMDANDGRSFPVTRDPAWRYFSANEMYGPGDAVVLAAMLRHLRPRRWIEVGSGFSSAALLDTLDSTAGLLTEVTFIEPNPERLDALLRDADRERVTVLQSGIQDIPLAVFDKLSPGDVLFLDTTHVCKTGSDVNHEFFQVLPRLASGVVVHLHDVFANFEYPAQWVIEENRSWNEQYLLRAFLMYNSKFEVLYANDGFARNRRDLVQARCPAILANPGGGFWMRKL